MSTLGRSTHLQPRGCRICLKQRQRSLHAWVLHMQAASSFRLFMLTSSKIFSHKLTCVLMSISVICCAISIFVPSHSGTPLNNSCHNIACKSLSLGVWMSSVMKATHICCARSFRNTLIRLNTKFRCAGTRSRLRMTWPTSALLIMMLFCVCCTTFWTLPGVSAS